MLSPLPEGWTIERRYRGPFKYIDLKGPEGQCATFTSWEANPVGVVYRFLDALLKQEAVPKSQSELPTPFNKETQDQITAVMLFQGTQQTVALNRVKAPSEEDPK